MKLSLTLLSTVLCVTALAQAPKWATYSAKADGFSILMPGPTRIQNQTTQGVKTNIYVSMVSPVVCAVSKTIVPKDMKQADIDGIRKGMISGMLRTSGGTATGEKVVSYGGKSGRQTDFKLANGGTGAMWIANAPGAVYSLTIANQKGSPSAEMKKFFNSFKAK